MRFRLAILSFWVGVMALFSFVVAPSAFAVLPSTGLAGDLVSRVLAVTEIIGVAASILLLLSLFLSREPRSRSRNIELFGYLATLLAMIASHFYFSPHIHAIRTGNGAGSPTFNRLHQLSVGSMTLCLLIGVLIIVMLLWNRRANA